MDTEEHTEIQKAIRSGKPETDEGPYYHDSWWEAYKGGVKGKLGGLAIGALIGAIIGLAAAAIVSSAAIIPIVAGFSAAGMLYGAHEFSEVGKVTGAVAAAHEKAESRMKSFESGKFSEIKQEIQNIKNLILGKKEEPVKTSIADAENPADYRTTHCDEHCDPKKSQPIFWNIAAIGLIIGAAVGALLAFGGVSEHILEALGSASGGMSDLGVTAASMTTLGLFGASFGINRDLFRQIFDKTDLLFKGIFKNSSSVEPAVSPAVQMEPQKISKNNDCAVKTIVYQDNSDHPQSDTYYRDKFMAQAKDALLRLDHTKSIGH